MWSRIKRFLIGPPPPEDPFRKTVRFDDTGFTRQCELARAMGLQEFWPWSDVEEFGFAFSKAMFPDPWYGDYMESLWFLRLRCEDGDLMRVDLEEDQLAISQLPPALLRHLPGLDVDVLREGLAVAGRGPRHFDGEGIWVAWRRTSAQPPQSPQSPQPPHSPQSPDSPQPPDSVDSPNPPTRGYGTAPQPNPTRDPDPA